MRAGIATAQIFSDEGKPSNNFLVSIEGFILEANRWTSLGSARTNTQGSVAIKINTREIESNAAPAFRLVESGTPRPRILAAGGAMRYDKVRDTIHVDFGQIDRLEETAFKMPNSSGATGFSRIAHTVAGVTLQQGRSEAALNRNLIEIAGARESLATVSRAREDVIIADVARDRIATGANIGTPVTAITATKEVDTLKSINLEQNQLILRKDQELATNRAELLQKTTQLETIQAALKAAQASEAAATSKAQQLEQAAGVKADVSSIVTGIGTRLSVANQTLRAQAHPFRVGNIKLDLRGRPSADGSEIELGGDAEKSGSGVSTELHVDQAASTDDNVTVPDVIGLTENTARRVIRSVGLRLSPARQTLKPNTGTPGQSISQHPTAGTQAKHGSEVLVVFGAAATQ